MQRRIFTRLMALGAGLAATVRGRLPAAEQAAPQAAPGKNGGKNGGGQNNGGPGPPTPVNVYDFDRWARSQLADATYQYISTGSGDGQTLRENVAAFRRLRLAPPLLRGVEQAALATTVLGQKVAFPILLAPVAAQRMYHPQGGLAAARAASAAGTIFGVSSSVGNSVEEIAAAAPGPKWFQLYMPRDRQVARRLVGRVERAGYHAIIVTVDLGEWKDSDRRNRFTLPKPMLVKHLRDTGFEQIHEGMSEQEILDFNLQAWDISLDWDVFDWLRKETRLPLLIKGVLRPDDAEEAVRRGIDGIVVSNHGGRRLDGMPATIEALPRVMEAVDGRAEVLLDGGIRRGTDVLKALALGARAVLVGRPYAWALAANGEAGVKAMLDLLRDELANALVASGCRKLSDVSASLLWERPL